MTRPLPTRRLPLPAAIVAIVALLFSTLAPAFGQGLGLPGASREKPMEIHADHGIEWDRTAKTYTARGNASASQGGLTVYADTLTAHYRETDEGDNEIWRLDARGHVRLASATQTAYGDTAVYDVDQGVLVLRGRNLRLEAGPDRIFARDSLEYWERRSIAVARGNAIVVRADKRLRADTLTAYFAENEEGEAEIRRVDALRDVVISSKDEIVMADEAVYDVQSGIAFLTGSVKITRGKNQLNGEKAEVNLNTGVSRIFSNVKGRFIPEDVDKGSEVQSR